jgi:hypothetical protein
VVYKKEMGKKEERKRKERREFVAEDRSQRKEAPGLDSSF